MADWRIIGQVGSITKKNQNYFISLAENKYKKNENDVFEKDHTLWFTCICSFEPKADIGDTVIADGTYIPSKNPNFPYIMKIEHIGIIKKKGE